MNEFVPLKNVDAAAGTPSISASAQQSNTYNNNLSGRLLKFFCVIGACCVLLFFLNMEESSVHNLTADTVRVKDSNGTASVMSSSVRGAGAGLGIGKPQVVGQGAATADGDAGESKVEVSPADESKAAETTTTTTTAGAGGAGGDDDGTLDGANNDNSVETISKAAPTKAFTAEDAPTQTTDPFQGVNLASIKEVEKVMTQKRDEFVQRLQEMYGRYHTMFLKRDNGESVGRDFAFRSAHAVISDKKNDDIKPEHDLGYTRMVRKWKIKLLQVQLNYIRQQKAKTDYRKALARYVWVNGGHR
jgi:hypothetical protein